MRLNLKSEPSKGILYAMFGVVLFMLGMFIGYFHAILVYSRDAATLVDLKVNLIQELEKGNSEKAVKMLNASLDSNVLFHDFYLKYNNYSCISAIEEVTLERIKNTANYKVLHPSNNKSKEVKDAWGLFIKQYADEYQNTNKKKSQPNPSATNNTTDKKEGSEKEK